MLNYQELYFKLMGEIANITERLIEVQQEMEKIYVIFDEQEY